MVRKLLFTLGAFIFCIGVAYSQQGSIKGKITDEKKEAVKYANVYLLQDEIVVGTAYTDDKGNYQFFSVQAGTFDIRVMAATTCEIPYVLKGVSLPSGLTKQIDISFRCSKELETVVVISDRPVYEKDETASVQRVTGNDVKNLPGRDPNTAIAGMTGVSVVDGSIQAIRGQRSETQKTMIDGMTSHGVRVDMRAISEIEVIQGGIPAEYGEGNAFISYTTKGVANSLHGGIEARGSVDGYNNFLAAGSITGPIVKLKPYKDSTDFKKSAGVGFWINASVSRTQDGRPLRGGYWQAKSEVIDNLINNPLRYDPDPLKFGAYSNEGSYLLSDAFEKKRVKTNGTSWDYAVMAKIDIVPRTHWNYSKQNNFRLSLKGSYQFSKGKSWDRGRAVFNNANNPEGQSQSAFFQAVLNHRVFQNSDPSAILKNVMYDLNFSYQYYNSKSYDARLKDNIFAYGHIGKYETLKRNYFERGDYTDTTTGMVWENMILLNNIYDSMVVFTPGIYNPDLVPYVDNFMAQVTPERLNDLRGRTVPYDLTVFQEYGALINGVGPSSIYSLFSMPGMPSNSYGKSETQAIGAKASLSMNMGNHELKMGFELERTSSRGWSVAPYGLWTLMRSKANAHINELDFNHPIYGGGDTIYFPRLNNGSQEIGGFDYNLRKALNLPTNGLEWLDIDNMDPSTFSLDMFTPEELLIENLISYTGYDYTGKKKIKSKTDMDNFFSEIDKTTGQRTYNVGAYEPVYMAMYLQDKFSIAGLLFNVGVRIDRFDANQSVLKDPYLFRSAHNIGSIKKNISNEELWKNAFKNVGNATDEWVPYVSNKGNVLGNGDILGNIIGYRNGDIWYDKNGKEIINAEDLLGATGGPILETLPDPTSVSKVEGKAFVDYEPQWSVMPRVSFSFPVSDNSVFTAHYNVITNRPTNLSLSPLSYLFIETMGTNVVSNPNLKSSKTIMYEIGFKQKLGNRSALEITAYYSENRDEIQAYRFTGAYPNTYYSYKNQDFGTVQGFTLGYILRRTQNIQLTAGYTLQFAKGTGSDASSNLAIIQSGQPNLRVLTNLSRDQRHRLTANVDYRLGPRKGPVTSKVTKSGNRKDVYWLENFGVNVNFAAASGLPYSRSSVPYSNIVSGTASRLSGTLNGSFRPWTFQCDLKIDRSFMLKMKSKDGEAKEAMLTVYLDIQNLFNFKNVLSVYTYTGIAEDDGYLSAAAYEQAIESQISKESYINYYRMVMQNPYNYNMPFRASLGIEFSF